MFLLLARKDAVPCSMHCQMRALWRLIMSTDGPLRLSRLSVGAARRMQVSIVDGDINADYS